MTGEYLKEFEKLNTTTESIYNLGNFKVLIILKDGTNLTDWKDVEYKKHPLIINNEHILTILRKMTSKKDSAKGLKNIL